MTDGRSAAAPARRPPRRTRRPRCPARTWVGPAVAPRVAAEEATSRADPAQAHQRLADPGVVDVALAVDEEVVLAEPVAGGPGLDRVRLMPRTANSVRISISAPGWSSAQERDQRGPVRAGGARAAARAVTPRRTGSPRWPGRARRGRAPPGRTGPRRRRRPARRPPARRRPGGPPRRWTRRHPLARPAGWLASQRRHCGMDCGWPPTA